VYILRYDDPGLSLDAEGRLVPSSMYQFGEKSEGSASPLPIHLYYDPYKQHYAALTLSSLDQSGISFHSPSVSVCIGSSANLIYLDDDLSSSQSSLHKSTSGKLHDSVDMTWKQSQHRCVSVRVILFHS